MLDQLCAIYFFPQDVELLDKANFWLQEYDFTDDNLKIQKN